MRPSEANNAHNSKEQHRQIHSTTDFCTQQARTKELSGCQGQILQQSSGKPVRAACGNGREDKQLSNGLHAPGVLECSAGGAAQPCLSQERGCHQLLSAPVIPSSVQNEPSRAGESWNVLDFCRDPLDCWRALPACWGL